MKLRAPAIDIPAEEPFRNDLLNRKQSASMLTELIRSADEPLVLCINASWGDGKSTFLRMWRQTLNNEELKSIYFNAWENDFSNDAFVSLIGEFDTAIQELTAGNTNQNLVRSNIRKVKKLGSVILKSSIPSAIKLATAGVLDLSKAAEDTISQLGEKIAEEQIEHYEKAKKSVVGFKKTLTDIASSISKSGENENPFPLVIFVDELDRCRPTYAVEILERVKHFFSVPNVVFVLAMDKIQLGHSIRSLYGMEIDVTGYLRRCIDIDYNLPQPDIKTFCRAQFHRYGFDVFFQGRQGVARYDRENLENMFVDLFSLLSCTLRDQEHCFSLLGLAIRTTPANNQLYPIPLSVLIVLKVMNFELYRRYATGNCKYDEIFKYFSRFPKGVRFCNENDSVYIEAWFIRIEVSEYDNEETIKRYMQEASEPDSHPNKKRAVAIVEAYKDRSFFYVTRGTLKNIIAKIDMVSQFDS